MCKKTKNRLKDYFEYKGREIKSYPASTITGKLMKGEIGGSKGGSSVPNWVGFDSPDKIKAMNRIELAIDRLKVEYYMEYLYIIMKYDYGLSYSQIVESTDESMSTIKRKVKFALKELAKSL